MDPTLLFLCSSFFILAAGLSNPVQYQTLVLNPLHKPTALEPESWPSASEADAGPTASNSSLHFRLAHRDSLLFSSNSTPEETFNLRLDRDAARVFSLHQTLAASPPAAQPRRTATRPRGFSSSVVSGLAQGSGEYFTQIGIGTPVKYAYMVLDTGSDIIWLQCSPCRRCYSQSDPIFDPAKSRSFSSIPCGTQLCRRLDVSGCNTRRNSCLYQVAYGDGSITTGDLSTETLTFRHGARIGRVALGCGHDNEGLFVAAAGLLGLGRGGLSFPSQAGRRFGRKFSYCLVDRTSSASPLNRPQASSLIFGEAAVPGSRPVAFTPMVSNPKMDTFYYIELTGVSVGGTRVPGVSASDLRLDPATGKGGVIVDSGTSVTRLARPAYNAMRDAFKAGAAELKAAAGGFSLFDTCYDLAGKTEVKVPTLVLHLGGGSAVSLPAENYLIPVDTKGTFCFAFAGTDNGVSIIGNIQQQGFRVVFDAAGNRVGFATRGC